MAIIYGKWSGLTKNGKRLSIAMTALRRIAAQSNYAGNIARQSLLDCAAVKALPRQKGVEKGGGGL